MGSITTRTNPGTEVVPTGWMIALLENDNRTCLLKPFGVDSVRREHGRLAPGAGEIVKPAQASRTSL